MASATQQREPATGIRVSPPSDPLPTPSHRAQALGSSVTRPTPAGGLL